MMNTSTPPPRQVQTSGASHRRTKYIFRLLGSLLAGVVAVTVATATVGVPPASALPAMVKQVTIVPSGYTLDFGWSKGSSYVAGAGSNAFDLTVQRTVQEWQSKKLVNGVWKFHCVEKTTIRATGTQGGSSLTNATIDTWIDGGATGVLRDTVTVSGVSASYSNSTNDMVTIAQWGNKCDKDAKVVDSSGRLLAVLNLSTFWRGVIANTADVIVSFAVTLLLQVGLEWAFTPAVVGAWGWKFIYGTSCLGGIAGGVVAGLILTGGQLAVGEGFFSAIVGCVAAMGIILLSGGNTVATTLSLAADRLMLTSGPRSVAGSVMADAGSVSGASADEVVEATWRATAQAIETLPESITVPPAPLP